MSVSNRNSKEMSKGKTGALTEYDRPEITPALIEHHIALGEQLRAETMHKLMRNGFNRIARAWRRIGQAVTGGALNTASRSLCNQKPVTR